jgi:DNA invertase Pin-like site-specific DNA recombinase
MAQAFGYLRVSGKGQVNGDGFERQELAIRAYAAGHGIEIVKLFWEKGVCGEVETMERPAFIDMVSELSDVRTVIVEKLDRLSRHLITQETCIADFTNSGLTLLSADPAECDLMANDPSRVLVRQIFGAIAQYDKAMLVAKLRAARRRCKLAGKTMEGQKPFGSRPGEQAIVGQIKAYRADGHSYEAIANILNADKVPTRKQGGKWFATSVKRIVTYTDSVESDKLTHSSALAA